MVFGPYLAWVTLTADNPLVIKVPKDNTSTFSLLFFGLNEYITLYSSLSMLKITLMLFRQWQWDYSWLVLTGSSRLPG
jgi:hypothetical protein